MYVETIGQIIEMLCNITVLLIELNAFSASINNIASDSSWSYISCIAWIAASAPASLPAHTCNAPAVLVTSFFYHAHDNFPAILRSTSPTPIGRNPGFLSRGINLHATNASRLALSSSFLTSILSVQVF